MAYDERPIAGQHVVITGATNGIGLEMARALIRRGARLSIIARNESKARRVAGTLATEPGVTTEPEIFIADLTDLQSVRDASEAILRRYDTIDVLANNAGAHHFSDSRTDDGHDEMTTANYLGPFLLTNFLLPLLVSAGSASIVNTASEAHRAAGRVDASRLGAHRRFGAVGSGRVYAQSKLFNILFTQELARRLSMSQPAERRTTVNAFCHGMVATGLVRDSDSVSGVWDSLGRTPLVRQPEQGARMGLRLILDAALSGTTGEFFTSTTGLRFLPRTRARRDQQLQRELWDRSAELVGLSATAAR